MRRLVINVSAGLLLSGPIAASGSEFGAFAAKYCVSCHGPEGEADLRLDQLAAPAAGSHTLWNSIADRIERREMPPPESDQPSEEERRVVLKLITASLAKHGRRRPAVRRLNRAEYEYTLRDLMGTEAELASLLPEDGQVQGFDNVAGGLGISSILMERYLEAADLAFESSLRRIKPSPASTRRAVLMDLKDNQASVKGNKGGVIESHGAFVDFTPGWPPARVDSAHPIEPGVYRVRVAVWPHEPGPDRTLAVGIFVGPLFGPGKREFQGFYDVTGSQDDPRIIEFECRMDAEHAVHILPWVSPEHVTWRDKHEQRPGVAIAWAETHGPLDQEFPSKSQNRLFGTSESIEFKEGAPLWMRHRKGVKLHFVDSADPKTDLAQVLNDFVPRAFRRPVDDSLKQTFVDLALARLEQGSTFEQAARAGICAVLCSPHFLLVNHEAEVDSYTIASRLSYFLWSSMPDDQLLELASQGLLLDSKVRRQQVERMLADEKSLRFVERFTDQWLDLRELEFTTPDKKLYPEYDELLLRSMLAETRGFFRHILDNDLSILNFIRSDFAVLNQRMADHYGIQGVKGHEKFRVVQLAENSVRGGILTHASVLKVTANGTTTSPILRGAWVLDRILGEAAPPPPPGVPAVEPDIRGAVSIRDQLDKHRADSSCNRCHSRIDPPGFALEEFDVIGGHRDHYRSLSGKGKRVGNTRYYAGLTVDSSGKMGSDFSFRNFVEFREQLVGLDDRVLRAFAERLLVYACGRPVTRLDSDSVDFVVKRCKERGGGLRSMIHAVVESELFGIP